LLQQRLLFSYSSSFASAFIIIFKLFWISDNGLQTIKAQTESNKER